MSHLDEHTRKGNNMSLEDIKRNCEQCARCELCNTRTNIVFGCGNEKARIMFVGEAPGEEEDRRGIPFVGRAGKLLDTMLVAVGVKREDIYIANILKCRPPRNRDPLPEEEDKCIDWLRQQFREIKPEIVVCLGRIAAKRMITQDFKITADHGKIYEKAGVKMMAIFHPAALLRNPAYKPLAFEDLERAVALAKESSKEN